MRKRVNLALEAMYNTRAWDADGLDGRCRVGNEALDVLDVGVYEIEGLHVFCNVKWPEPKMRCRTQSSGRFLSP